MVRHTHQDAPSDPAFDASMDATEQPDDKFETGATPVRRTGKGPERRESDHFERY